MGLSGAENQEISQQLTQIFETNFSSVAKKCFVTSDSGASIATAFKNGIWGGGKKINLEKFQEGL